MSNQIIEVYKLGPQGPRGDAGDVGAGIDDQVVGPTTAWSSTKIDAELDLKANLLGAVFTGNVSIDTLADLQLGAGSDLILGSNTEVFLGNNTKVLGNIVFGIPDTFTVDGRLVGVDGAKLDLIADGAQVNVGTDLSASRTSVAVNVLSSTGNNVTLTGADATNAGLMVSTDKVKLDDIAVGAQVNVITTDAPSDGTPYSRQNGGWVQGGALGRDIDVAQTGVLAAATTWLVDTSIARSRALPAGADGDEIGFADDVGDASTNTITITPNGAEKIMGVNYALTISTSFARGVLKFYSANSDWRLVP